MTSSNSYANFTASEGILTGEKLISFPWKPRKFIITNNSANVSLLFKFNESEEYGTLLPTETVSLELASKTIWIDGPGANYRIWGMG